MPDYMQEQTGELMPKVVNRLMPHMISDVVPLVTQPLIHYLKERNEKPIIDYARWEFDIAIKGYFMIERYWRIVHWNRIG